MSTMMTGLPKFFDQLRFVQGKMDMEGYRTDTAPCGCQIYLRMVTGGRLAGHFYGDRWGEVCDAHCRWCPSCGQQTWPHMDCMCNEADFDQPNTRD